MENTRTSTPVCMALLLASVLLFSPEAHGATVKPGDVINKANASTVSDLLSPGNLVLVQQGMEIDVVATDKLDWPPPYKTATEKYSTQVTLTPDGEIGGYIAGQPFPLLDPNDPRVAQKIMWDFSFRPLYSDDADLRYGEIAAFAPNSNGTPVGYFTVGHFAFYNNVGRIEVPPVPTDPDAQASGVRYRFAYYPLLEPSTIRGYGLIRYRHLDPKIDDNTWTYNPTVRRLRRQSPQVLSDALAAIIVNVGLGGGAGAAPAAVTTIDPDSYFGFSAKIEDFTYRFLGDKTMLACVHARNSPEVQCPSDGGHTICPENWELRHVYVIEADMKPGHDFSIPKRILYIDSEGWFVTASDQYDRDGKLWKTIATFNAYRDRPVPDARVAVYPYKRMFQLGLVDADLQLNYSSVIYMPGREAQEHECWYIDMGTVDNSFFQPEAMRNAGH